MKQGLLLVMTLLSGCTEMMEQPTREELDWNPPTLSKTGCPDLSGRYASPEPANISYRWAFPFGFEKELYPSREIYLRDKNLNVFIVVESQSTGIRVQADNGRNSIQSFAPYDGLDIGCHNGILVSRFVGRPIRPGESGNCTSLGYGENHIYLNENRDLVIASFRRTRCSTWGSLKKQDPKERIAARPTVFRRLR